LLPTSRLIRPAGQLLELDRGRPVDMVLSRDGKLLFVKDRAALRVVDAVNWKLLQTVTLPGGASLHGIAVSHDGATVWVTNAADRLHEFRKTEDGTYALSRSIHLPGPGGSGSSFPCGITLLQDEATAYVCLSRNNSVGVVDLAAGALVREISVGVAPYDVVLDGVADRLWVTVMGGKPPAADEPKAPSAGTPTLVDDRGVAASGGVYEVSLSDGRAVGMIPVGLQPCELLLLADSNLLLCANANSDSVTWIDTDTKKVIFDLTIKPDTKLPFGSMPNALAVSADGKSLYVALAGNNAVAVVDISHPRAPYVLGFVPSGWYPVALVSHGANVFVAANKGIGSRTPVRDMEKGWNSHDHRGSLQRFAAPSLADLARMTSEVRRYGKVPQILRSFERTGAGAAAPQPVPARLGDPSVFEHVIYVIKENRTYDQMFGDIEKGDGDPKLCTFGRDISPNHHALAEQFVLLDNYYCNGVLSADGHSWATEGNVTPYLEKAFGGFTRSYTFGDDPLTYSSSGFIWDGILGAGLSFRNYGEMDSAVLPSGWGFKEVWEAYRKGERTEFGQDIGIARLRSYSCRDYPGWSMAIPDVLRMDRFLEEFRQFERDGDLPNFVLIYLPQDHTSGTSPGWPTPRAHVADNDLAIGRLVEAVSHSRFWPKTVIFVNEDDPQNGFDHVDGHRSICLVISPYTKRGAVISEFYNQTSVLHTIARIFGVPPLNQQDASAPLMSTCFSDTPDLTPYRALNPAVPLDELNPPLSSLGGPARYWAEVSTSVPMYRRGLKTAQHEQDLNRVIWFAMKGYDTPYPEELSGAHGKGLGSRRLVHEER
jgi:YVTN family beta-propeller protein